MDIEEAYTPPKANLSEPIKHYPIASRTRRLLGSLIDTAILAFLVLPVIYLMGYWDKLLLEEFTLTETAFSVLLDIGAYSLVNGYLLAYHGQTIGKKIVGTKIISVHNNEILPVWKVVLVRYAPFYLVYHIPVIGPLIVVLDALFVFRADSRCIHDLVAGTIVVRVTARN